MYARCGFAREGTRAVVESHGQRHGRGRSGPLRGISWPAVWATSRCWAWRGSSQTLVCDMGGLHVSLPFPSYSVVLFQLLDCGWPLRFACPVCRWPAGLVRASRRVGPRRRVFDWRRGGACLSHRLTPKTASLPVAPFARFLERGGVLLMGRIAVEILVPPFLGCSLLFLDSRLSLCIRSFPIPLSLCCCSSDHLHSGSSYFLPPFGLASAMGFPVAGPSD